jgi:hypothetical protein
MSGKSKDTLRRNYKDRALKLLFKFERPTSDDVWHDLCRHDNCPTIDGKCDYAPGPLKGRSCMHVITVKSIVENVRSILDDRVDLD